MYELELEKKLITMGLKVEMWPEFDKYDLKVVFPTGLVWAIDVKDYSNPNLLVKSLKPFPEKPYYDEAFYIIPQYRYRFNRNYEKVFRDNYPHERDKLQLLMERNFITKVNTQLGGEI